METKGWKIFKESLNYLGSGSSTNSKIPVFEEEPAIIVKGNGCRVYDIDGNEYIDFRCALGPVTLGYNIPEINSAIIEQLKNGIIFSYPHILEGEVAKMLTEVIPFAEKVRFLKTGGEAISACIKIARNYTKRKKIIHCGYNGWLNCFDVSGTVAPGISRSSPIKGIPPEISSLHKNLPWADFEKWEKVFKEEGEEIAGVVIASNYKEMEKGKEFLPFIRKLTQKYGSLMIMDEIVTGFRVALGGVSEYFGFIPDLAVFSKGIANGMPISAYLGKSELIDTASEIGISSTFGGETLSLSACKAVIEFYQKNNVIEYLWKTGKKMWDGINDLFKKYGIKAEIKGFPVCPFFDFKNAEERDLFFRKCFKNGVIFYNVGYVCYSHKEDDIKEALEKVEKSIKEMKNGSV
ncbi:MAG: aminotransferase class III-fold pyridoxal phosphate-dependent enzyme [Candidatus Omnitrophica bacterium]|nr:aminotransferase class III-fold pyridoxal phosphate-dependent enzyme [Candidatus Omnitrophota bacterium]